MNIFYLEWIHKRPTVCEFRNTRPKDFTYHTQINIRGFKDVFERIDIYGNINPEFKNYEFPQNPYYTKRSFLISHLQKSIRKMHHDKSIKIAKHIIDLDISSLLRRLPIIMFEDVIPHSSLPILIWLLIASSKGFEFKTIMIQWLLGVVYFLSSKSKHDEYKKLKETNIKIIQDKHLTNDQLTFIKSLYIRISYGGMKGDMEMINYFIDFWYERFKNNKSINDEKIKFITEKLEPLPRNKWDLCANDFHCNPQIIQDIKKQYDLYSEEYIKKLIWEYSSSINKRTSPFYNEEEYKDWLIIKKYVRYLQRNMNF